LRASTRIEIGAQLFGYLLQGECSYRRAEEEEKIQRRSRGCSQYTPCQGWRVVENKHSHRFRSMTCPQGECSCRCVEEEEEIQRVQKFNVVRVIVLNTPLARPVISDTASTSPAPARLGTVVSIMASRSESHTML